MADTTFQSFGSSMLGAFKQSPLDARSKTEPPLLYVMDGVLAAPTFLAKLEEWNVDDWSVIRRFTMYSSTDLNESPYGANGKNFMYTTDDNPDLQVSIAKGTVDGLTLILNVNLGDFTVGPRGGGGDDVVVWNTEIASSVLQERLPDDLSLLSSNSVASDCYGCGGDQSVVYVCSTITDTLYKIDPSDFSVMLTAASPTAFPIAINGTTEVLYHVGRTSLGDLDQTTVYELDPSDFSIIRSVLSTTIRRGTGIGG